MTEQEQGQEFEVTTSAQVERTYIVKATDAEAAHKRLRRYLEDPELIREGLVTLDEKRTEDTSPQRVKSDTIKPVQKPRAVKDGASGKDAPAAASAS